MNRWVFLCDRPLLAIAKCSNSIQNDWHAYSELENEHAALFWLEHYWSCSVCIGNRPKQSSFLSATWSATIYHDQMPLLCSTSDLEQSSFIRPQFWRCLSLCVCVSASRQWFRWQLQCVQVDLRLEKLRGKKRRSTKLRLKSIITHSWRRFVWYAVWLAQILLNSDFFARTVCICTITRPECCVSLQ